MIRDPVRALQRPLYRTAKADPGRRFHALADKVYRRDVLWRRWVAVRNKDGAPGIDETTLAQVNECGVDRLLGELVSQRAEGEAVPSAAGPAGVYPEIGSGREEHSPCLRCAPRPTLCPERGRCRAAGIPGHPPRANLMKLNPAAHAGRRLAASVALACSAILLPATTLPSSAAAAAPAAWAASSRPASRPEAFLTAMQRRAGTWKLLPAAPVTTFPGNTVSVWTGREMIIHGSLNSRAVTFAYRPATTRWKKLARGPALLTLRAA